MTITHTFISAIPDGADTTVVRPSDWNADHTIGNDTVTEAQLSISDNTTKDFSTTAHGFVPKGTNVGNFLKDDGTWAAVTASVTLDGIAAAAADQAGIANADWNIRWNWQKTTNSEDAFTFSETAASTNGTSSSGVPNQVLVKIATVAASTMSPLSVYSRAAHVFSVSPTAAQILATSGSRTNPAYGFAAATGSGMLLNSSTLEWAIGGALAMDVSASQIRGPKGTAAAPTYTENISWANSGLFFPATGQLAVSCAGREMLRWAAASSGGGWQIMDEADSSPSTTNLDDGDSGAIYIKAGNIVFAQNVGGAMKFLYCPIDGTTTTWTADGTGP